MFVGFFLTEHTNRVTRQAGACSPALGRASIEYKEQYFIHGRTQNHQFWSVLKAPHQIQYQIQHFNNQLTIANPTRTVFKYTLKLLIPAIRVGVCGGWEEEPLQLLLLLILRLLNIN